MIRLESLERQLRRDPKVVFPTNKYIQAGLDITRHVERYGIDNPPQSTRYYEVRVVR